MLLTYGSLLFYIAGIFFAILAIFGKSKWTLLFIVFLLPLQNVLDKLQNFPAGKDFIDILMITMLIVWVLKSISVGKNLFLKSPLNAIFIITIFYATFALVRGNFYLNYYDFFHLLDARVQDWKNFCVLPLLFFLTASNIQDKKWVMRTLFVMCLSMLLMDRYTVSQISDFSGLVSREKIHGTFQWLGPNEVAAFYNQFTVLLIAIFFSLKKSWLKLFLAGLIFINLYCVTFLFSRAAYIGLVVGLFFLFAIRKKVLLIPLIAVIIFWQTLLPQDVKTRIEMTTNAYGELDASSENRVLVWQQSVDLFKSNPIVGVGFGVFRYLGFALGDTHNIYIKVMAEQGLIGLIIFLLLIGTMFKEGWRLFRRGDDEFSRSLGLGFAMCIVVLMVNNMFGDRWTYLPLSAYLWIFAGLVARLNIISENNRVPQSPGRQSPVAS